MVDDEIKEMSKGMETYMRLHDVMDSTMYEALQAKIETQVILQLLVSKNIVTKEEVDATREKVIKNTEYGKLFTKLADVIAIKSKGYTEFLMLKKLFLGEDSLSEKEDELLTASLQLEYDKEKSDADKFEELFSRKLAGGSLTDEENQFCLEWLDKIKDGGDK